MWIEPSRSYRIYIPKNRIIYPKIESFKIDLAGLKEMSLKDSLSRLFGGKENKILRLLKDYLDSILRVVNELKTLLSMVMGKEAFSSPSILDTKIEMISVLSLIHI